MVSPIADRLKTTPGMVFRIAVIKRLSYCDWRREGKFDETSRAKTCPEAI